MIEKPGPYPQGQGDRQPVRFWMLDLERRQPSALNNRSLDKSEQERAQVFRREQDRQRYCLTRIAVRTVLSTCCPGVEPAHWRFCANRHGKPAIASPELDAEVHFNVSHSGRWLVIAVADSTHLGVDVERVSSDRNLLAIARRYFTASEYAEMCDMTPSQQRARFFALWTLKEAYSKACGNALVPVLGDLEISFPGATRIAARVRSAPTETGWQFFSFSRGDYRLALARRGQGSVVKLPAAAWEIDDPFKPGSAARFSFEPEFTNY